MFDTTPCLIPRPPPPWPLHINVHCAQACGADRTRLCGHLPLGAPGVLRCLQDAAAAKQPLSPECEAQLFDTGAVLGGALR